MVNAAKENELNVLREKLAEKRRSIQRIQQKLLMRKREQLSVYGHSSTQSTSNSSKEVKIFHLISLVKILAHCDHPTLKCPKRAVRVCDGYADYSVYHR